MYGRCDVVPVFTLWEVVVSGDLGDVDDAASRFDACFSNIDDSLEDILEVTRDVLAASLVRAETESSTAVSSAWRTAAPADGTFASCIMLTWRIAQSSVIYFIRLACERCASRAAIAVLMT